MCIFPEFQNDILNINVRDEDPISTAIVLYNCQLRIKIKREGERETERRKKGIFIKFNNSGNHHT